MEVEQHGADVVARAGAGVHPVVEQEPAVLGLDGRRARAADKGVPLARPAGALVVALYRVVAQGLQVVDVLYHHRGGERVEDGKLAVYLFGEEDPVFVGLTLRRHGDVLLPGKLARVEVAVRDGGHRQAQRLPVLKDFEGHVDAVVDFDHPRVLDAAPAAAGGVLVLIVGERRVGKFGFGGHKARPAVKDRIGEPLVKVDTIRTGGVAHARDAVFAQRPVKKVHAPVVVDGCGVKHRL